MVVCPNCDVITCLGNVTTGKISRWHRLSFGERGDSFLQLLTHCLRPQNLLLGPGQRDGLEILTVLAEETVREAEFASSIVRITATVTGEEFLPSSGLRRLSPVVCEPSAPEEVGHWGEEVPDGVEELSVGGVEEDGER